MNETHSDTATAALALLVPVMAEEAMFASIAAPSSTRDAVEGTLKRRHDAHVALVQGMAAQPGARVLGAAGPRMLDSFDAWVILLTRAMAPVAPPAWLPMSDVIKQKVTLEVGARGLRSFFSSKPSDKDVQRVKRLGSLTVRALRAVFAADGLLDPLERRNLAAVIASLGLPEADGQALLDEDPISVERLDIYGELESEVSRAILNGAWFAAAADGLDPREEQVIRALAVKLQRSPEEAEEARATANTRVENARIVGLALVETVRAVLGDAPNFKQGNALAVHLAMLATPRRYQEEAIAQASAPAPAAPIGKRYANLGAADRGAILAAAWGAALHEDPAISRRAALRARFDRLASELGDEGGRVRSAVEGPIDEALATLAAAMR